MELMTRKESPVKNDLINLLQLSLIDNTSLWDNSLSNLQTATVIAAYEIGFFNILQGKLYSLDEIANELLITYSGAEALASVLSALNLIKWQNHKLLLTLVAETYLVPTSLFYWGNTYNFLLSKPENRILVDLIINSIKDNKGQLNIAGNDITDMWREGSITNEAANMFTNLMHSLILAPAIGAVKTRVFSDVKNLLDIGGGSGCFSAAFAEQHLDKKATIFDLPNVCEIAKQHISKFQANKKISFYPGNFFNDKWPEDYDGILFSQIFHDWPLDYCKKLAKSAYEALQPGRKIFIHEMLLNEDKTGPLTVTCFNLMMLILHGSQQFTKTELFKLLHDVGFVNLKVVPGFSYFSIIIGEKPS